MILCWPHFLLVSLETEFVLLQAMWTIASENPLPCIPPCTKRPALASAVASY